MLSLQEREWKTFKIKNLIPEIERGKRLKNEDHIPGQVPYISSSAVDNGVADFVGNTQKVRKFKDCLSLANSGSVGSCFYEPFEFVASDHITHLKKPGLTKYQYLFLATMLSRLNNKYNFNREINDVRISKETILLPITSSGEPDWQFMEDFIKEREKAIKQSQIVQIQKRLKELGKKKTILPLNQTPKNSFIIGQLFTISRPKPRNKDEYSEGNTPFVASGSENNGVMKMVSKNDDELYDSGNTLTVSPVDGSSFYQPTPFLGRGGAGSSIIILKNDDLNLYRGLFFAKMISVACSNFSYGRMGNVPIMNKKRIILPIKSDGTIDYPYMEQYIKNLMIDKYTQYIKYLES